MMTRLLLSIAVLLGTVLSGGKVPSEADLLGQWGYCSNSYVFMEAEGPTPDKKLVDSHLTDMGATKSNLVLTFSEGHKGNLRLGEKDIDFDWTINPATKEFKVTVALFTIKGYLVKDGGKLSLVYKRSDLFMMMRFLCTAAGRKHISPLGELLDSTRGLTVAMEFSK